MGWSRIWKRINSKRKLWNNLGCSIINRSFEIHGIEVSCIKNHKLWWMQFEYTSYWNSLQYFPMVEVPINFNNHFTFILRKIYQNRWNLKQLWFTILGKFWPNASGNSWNSTYLNTLSFWLTTYLKHAEFLQYKYGRRYRRRRGTGMAVPYGLRERSFYPY